MREAAYCGTRAIYDDMEMSAKSLVYNSQVERIHFIIEDDEFPRPLPDIIQCHNMSGQTFFKPDGPNMHSQYTYMAMMRIALCHVLPDTDRVLSLDADTLALRECTCIWDIKTDGCYLAAAEEWHRSRDGLQYCNFGVVLYDLANLRDGKADECIDVLNRREYTWVEQDVGNYLCQGRIAPMDGRFNSCFFTDKNASHPVILHYAGAKSEDWVGLQDPQRFVNMTWEEALAHRG